MAEVLGVDQDTAGAAVFVLSLLSGVLLSAVGFVNPTSRWHQLRMSSCRLTSVIWQYRARVGPFAETARNPRSAQQALCAAMHDWGEAVVAGTDLGLSTMEKVYPERVYKHCQRSGTLKPASGLLDDHHSPVSPNAYLELRLVPARQFYQARIPVCSRWRVILQYLVFFCSAGAAGLAHFKMASYVAVVSSVAAAIVSWVEFSQLGQKVQRYTCAIRSIKDLHRWWVSLGEVEQKNREHVAHLVMKGEAILNAEHQAWSSGPVTGGSAAAGDEEERPDEKKA